VCQIVNVVRRDNVPIGLQPRSSRLTNGRTRLWLVHSIRKSPTVIAGQHAILCAYSRADARAFQRHRRTAGLRRHRPAGAGRGSAFQPLMLGPTRERVTRMMTRRSRTMAAR